MMNSDKLKSINWEEHKQIQLDILKKIHSFCEKNGLSYFLAFGSLIGAVRHNGFIPWDDDIDIVMPRPDYDRFVSLFNGTYSELECIAPELDWNYYASYANVHDKRTVLFEKQIKHKSNSPGVKIDIFPLDGVPSDIEVYNRYYSCVKKLKFYIGIKNAKLSYYFHSNIVAFIKIAIRKILLILYSRSSLQKKINKLVRSISYDESEFVDDVVFNSYDNARVKKSVFKDYILHDFEGLKFRIPVGYDEFLKVNYGDYMKLPPKSKQVPHHNFDAYWKQ